MELIVLGASHRTAPVDVRDRVQMTPAEVERFCAELAAERDQIMELSVLSTCNRTEIYSLVQDRDLADRLVRGAVERLKGVPYMGNGKYTYALEGRDMVRHLFNVAAGIDSLMVGEPQILGQVRDAHKLSDRGRFSGAIMTRLFNSALHVGKRARTETDIGVGTVSVAYAAVEMALKVFDGLTRHTVAVVGAGETGALVATHLAEQNPGRLLILNRTLSRAEELASGLRGEALELDALGKVLRDASVVVTATSSPEMLLRLAELEPVLRKRRRPLVLIDISNPRTIDPALAGVESVFLYDLDALEGIAEQNRESRAREIPKVEAIVEEEVDAFFEWYDALHVVPVLRALRDRFHEIGRDEVERLGKGLTPDERHALETFARSLINKLLHQPTTRIKGIEAMSTHGLHKLVAIQELFELELDRYLEDDVDDASPPDDRPSAEGSRGAS